MGMNDAWGNFEIETEKVIDDNPQTWINAAKDDYENKKYNQAIEKIKQAKEFAVGNENIIFVADIITFKCYMDMGDYNKALQKLSNQPQDKIKKHFSENCDELKSYLHKNLPQKIKNKITEYWNSIVAGWMQQQEYGRISENLQDIDSQWFCSIISHYELDNLIKNNKVDILRVLSKGGYPFSNYRDNYGCNVLQKAADYNVFETLSFFLELGCCNVNDCNHHGNDALFFALRGGTVNSIRELLAHGASANKVYKEYDVRQPALQLGMSHCCGIEVISCLLEYGADANCVDSDGYDALHYAVMSSDHIHNNVKKVELLLDYGAKINSKNNKPLLCMACKKTTVSDKLLSILVERGADISYVDEEGYDAFYYATKNLHKDVVSKILNKGININKKYKNGDTVLHVLAQNNHWSGAAPSMWRYLLSRQPDINIQNGRGYTPLMESVDHNWHFSDELDMARALVRAGADTSIKSNDGKTVRSIMRSHNIDPQKLYNNSSSNFFTKLFS